MTRLSRFQRFALLTASTTVITGGALLPGTAFAAPAPHAPSVAAADARWVETKDADSGVTARLPGKSTVKDMGGGRTYVVGTDAGITQFSVVDSPGGGQNDLDSALENYLSGYNEPAQSSDEKLRSTDVSTETTADGHRTLQADLTAPDGTVGRIGFIDGGDYVVQIASVGLDTPDTVRADYQQILDSVQLPADQPDRAL
ncbi:hypothetical protein [Streptomyces caeruleatus]|uniref:Uncharacterized protein n=1 Tax=Streptomyces caeruleatus TaxID=661399 RepID=A0A101TTM2_9ACTN|nr:hypothetical protein [Streptomyces caeruleatus]KUN98262.1 hypothetical protein AQJ67_28370 [Streptomyces caeruleatus]